MPARALLVATNADELEVPGSPDLREVDVVSPLVIVPRFAEMKQAIAHLAEFRTIALTSGHAVDALVGALRALGHDVRALFGVRLAAVGGGTAARLGRYGLSPDLCAAGGGAALAEELLALGDLDRVGPVMHPRALDGRPELVEVLRAAGVRVDVVSAYEALPDVAALKTALLRHHAEPYAAIGFASPRGVTALLEAWGGVTRLGPARLAAIGPTTRAALEQAGLHSISVPETPSLVALLATILAR